MTVDELKAQGNAALKAGNYNDALKAYDEAIKLEPQNHILYSNRSNIYYQAANYHDALKDAEECIKINPGFAKGFVRKIDALNALGRVFDAQTALDEAAAAHPNDPVIQERKKQQDESQNIFGDRLGRNAQELQARINAYPELAAEVKKDPTLFQRMDAVRQNPTNLDVFMQDQQLQRALFTLMGMGSMFGAPGASPNTPFAPQSTPQPPPQPKPTPAPPKQLSPEEEEGLKLKEEGNKLFASKDYNGAIAKYEEAFKVHKNITYLNNVSTALLKLGKGEEALAKAEEALEYAREHGGASLQEKAKALAKAGSALYHLGRLKEAQARLKDSMLECRDKQTLQLLGKVEDELEKQKINDSFDPAGAAQMKEEGNALVKAQKFMEAAERFTEALRKLPAALDNDETRKLKAQLYNNRAIALFKSGQIHASYEDSQQVLSLDPVNVKALLRKGQIERIRKQYYLSVKSYQKVLELEPGSTEGREGYQKTYMKIAQLQNGQLSKQEVEEIRNIALQDEEVAKIAKDPGIAQAIQQLQSNPQAAQQLMADPAFKDKLETLIHAGIIQVGGGM